MCTFLEILSRFAMQHPQAACVFSPFSLDIHFHIVFFILKAAMGFLFINLVLGWRLRSAPRSCVFPLEPRAPGSRRSFVFRASSYCPLPPWRVKARGESGPSRWTVRSCITGWWWEAEAGALGKASSDFTSRICFCNQRVMHVKLH